MGLADSRFPGLEGVAAWNLFLYLRTRLLIGPELVVEVATQVFARGHEALGIGLHLLLDESRGADRAFNP